ncbi:MAG: DUF6320 domain-containing protein [Bacilli bacterium]
MKYCEKCKLKIMQDIKYCPLCKSILIEKEKSDYDTIFPIRKKQSTGYLAYKIMFFVSLLICFVTFFINIFFPGYGWWSLFVIAAIACAWVSLIYVVKNRRNVIKTIFYQVLIFYLVVLLWDLITGWKGWSLTYAVPSFITGTLITIFVLLLCIKEDKNQNLFYYCLESIFGLSFILFIIFKVVSNIIPSFICVLVSITSILVSIVFYRKTVIREIQKKTHL